jgi:hypothetical protein
MLRKLLKWQENALRPTIMARKRIKNDKYMKNLHI